MPQLKKRKSDLDKCCVGSKAATDGGTTFAFRKNPKKASKNPARKPESESESNASTIFSMWDGRMAKACLAGRETVRRRPFNVNAVAESITGGRKSNNKCKVLREAR
ncbi:MAG: hypothetical protein GY696_08275 [Gammaproteobacteria bacterium]|nr:hypothetical protein [Gammaproteobacteria bacterium]